MLSPLAGTLPEQDFDRIAHALGLVFGTEAMIALTDAVGLDAPAAKDALLDAGRWLLAGALAELTATPWPLFTQPSFDQSTCGETASAGPGLITTRVDR